VINPGVSATAWAAVTGVEDVPDVSADLYLDINHFAGGTPHWLQEFVAFGTDAILVMFPILFLACWWRARRADARTMTLALLAPVATGVTYLISEIVKSWWQEERPCRTLAPVDTIRECPAHGDWSFPSNHSAIAGAAATAVFIAWRRMAAIAVPAALLAAGSRVFVGAHYPHDVAAGLLLGAVIAAPLVSVLATPLHALVGRLREQDRLGPVLGGRPAIGTGDTTDPADINDTAGTENTDSADDSDDDMTDFLPRLRDRPTVHLPRIGHR
jgi:membrane-associated phospholipid phosphatase